MKINYERIKHEIASSEFIGKWCFVYDLKEKKLYFINGDFVVRIF